MKFVLISSTCKLYAKTYAQVFAYAEKLVSDGEWVTIKRKVDQKWVRIIELFP